MIYYSTNHAQEQIYFGSNSENDEKVIVSFRFFQLFPLHKETPRTVLIVTVLFTCISQVDEARKTKLHRLI